MQSTEQASNPVGARIHAAPASFWDALPRPIIGLAPMDGVSDHPFRHIQAAHGRPDVVYTEFTRVEGICRARQITVLENFLYSEIQRPVIAQIYGVDPEAFRQTAILVCQLGFQGVDINMGCPSKNVAGGGAGAGLIQTPGLAQEIVRAVRAGVSAWANGATVRDCPSIHPNIAGEVERRSAKLPPAARLHRAIPVSIKTRIGYDAPVVEEWIPALLETEPAAIALHGRTLSQAYRGRADWTSIARAAELAQGTPTLILGNGDLASRNEGVARVVEYGLDGALIGRAALGNPFVFQTAPLSVPDMRLGPIAMEHGYLFEATFRHAKRYHFPPMRKHLNAYARRMGMPVPQRVKLLQSKSPQEAEAVLRAFADFRP
ncbi:MAG: tRNA-dihydrouridine synthase [Caldilineaceae bacterium]|nr:tRNA-dihydrouridine synthase [Caldilineaceae bacterium]